MKLKLLSFVAIAGLSGAIVNQVLQHDSSIKIGKYSPRVEKSDLEAKEAKGYADYVLSLRSHVATGEMDYDAVRKAQEKLEHQAGRAGALGLEFEFMGPSNVGGRTRGIVIDNEDSDRIYAASVSGGMYVSTDGGSTWGRFWEHPSRDLSCLTQAANGDLYAGTGSSFEGSADVTNPGQAGGVGIYKSTDRGESWQLLASTDNNAAFRVVNDIKAHPTEPNTLVAGCGNGSGVQISTDGGASWRNDVVCLNGTAYPAPCLSLDWSNDGKYLYAAIGSGSYVFSGTAYTQACGITTNAVVGDGGRFKLSASPTDESTVYAITTVSGFYSNIKISTDNGKNWNSFNPPMPVSNDNFELFGDNGQANYDLSFTAVPHHDPNAIAKDKLFVGGVQLWRYDGNWTQAALQGSSGGNPTPQAVHPDHHEVIYDPKDVNKIFFVHDGGVTKSLDGGYTFFDMNKGYSTTQYYSIDYAPYDYAIGGTQDNGNLFVTPFRPGNPDYGVSVHNRGILNGDGFDAAVSQIVDLKYTSAQFGNLGRGAITSPQGSGACDPYCGNSKFYTYVTLWESANDLTSKDSIVFEVDTFEFKVALGTGSRTTFEGQITPDYDAAQIIPGSIRIGTIDDQLVYNGNGGFTGNGSGTLDTTDFKFTVTFDQAPALNAIVTAYYTVNFPAGSVITVPSETEDLPVTHVIRTNLSPGDVLKIQDPIQSLIAMQTNQKCVIDPGTGGVTCTNTRGIIMARKALVLGENPVWMHFAAGNTTQMNFSPNGDELFYIASGNLWVLKGLNNVYTQEDLDKAEAKQIFAPSGNVTNVNFNPQNENQLIVSVGNYGVTNHVYILDRTPGTDLFAPRSIQGSLPDMPVYDAIFDKTDADKVLIGTDFGLYSTDESSAAAPTWTKETNIWNVPVWDIDQQLLDHTASSNGGMIYVGTHGAGIWKTATLVGIDEISHDRASSGYESSITVYPNPISDRGNMKLTVNNPENAIISIYGINGQVMKTIHPVLIAGDNDVSFDASDLPSGTYFVRLQDGSSQEVAKFVKMK